MKLIIARAMLFTAGFLLWGMSALIPHSDRIREGWDNPAYWNIGMPLMLVLQVAAAIVAHERYWRAPLWMLSGHALAIVLIHPLGNGLALLPLAIMIIGLPAYAFLFAAAVVGSNLSSLVKSSPAK
jgi:hypothetical protein